MYYSTVLVYIIFPEGNKPGEVVSAINHTVARCCCGINSSSTVYSIVRLGMMLVVVITQLVCGNCMNAVDLKGTVSREYRQLLCIG